MFNVLKNIKSAVCAMALFTAAAYGQTMSISGSVLGEDGKPMTGAQMRIERIDMKGSYKVKTDKKGNYLYAGLPIGKYTVILEKDGKEVDKIPNLASRGGAPIENVNFNLAKAKGPDAAAAAAAAAAADAQRGMSKEEKEAYEKNKKANEEAMAKNKALNDAFNAGKEAAAAKNWGAAIEAFDNATKIDPAQHVVYGNLADAYLARNGAGDVDKGIAAYAKAVELKGDDPAYHNNYALALAKGKKFDEAQAELTKAAQMDPAAAGKYYYNLGAVYVNTGQGKPAADAFKKAIDADPNYAEAYYQMGLVMFGEATTAADGRIVPPAGTSDMFNKYISLKPDGPDAASAKAMLEAMGSKVETNINMKKAAAPAAAPAPKKK